MAETHLLMNVAAFVMATWWTKSWLMDPVGQRWRYIVASLSGIPMWIFVAYTSTRVADTSSGVTQIFGSYPLSVFAAMMAFVSAIGFLLGLYLWAEDEGRETAEELPDSVRPELGD